MKPMVNRALVFIITLVILLAIFLFVLPSFDLQDKLGGYYLPVMILGSIILSYIVSYLVGMMLR